MFLLNSWEKKAEFRFRELVQRGTWLSLVVINAHIINVIKNFIKVAVKIVG
jgi:hypothetical protein